MNYCVTSKTSCETPAREGNLPCVCLHKAESHTQSEQRAAQLRRAPALYKWEGGCLKKPEARILKLADFRAKGDSEAADKADELVNFPALGLYLSEPGTPLCGWRSRGAG